ncbi:hypothetical protein BaRGS_00020892 [Batillaria attramentaria]|uniref:Uncharacterized protein n=1 Tax=Batillaria attramentaria TaxID=370345 RepID=A0ABD0KKX2_9CAEN
MEETRLIFVHLQCCFFGDRFRRPQAMVHLPGNTEGTKRWEKRDGIAQLVSDASQALRVPPRIPCRLLNAVPLIHAEGPLTLSQPNGTENAVVRVHVPGSDAEFAHDTYTCLRSPKSLERGQCAVQPVRLEIPAVLEFAAGDATPITQLQLVPWRRICTDLESGDSPSSEERASLHKRCSVRAVLHPPRKFELVKHDTTGIAPNLEQPPARYS